MKITLDLSIEQTEELVLEELKLLRECFVLDYERSESDEIARDIEAIDRVIGLYDVWD